MTQARIAAALLTAISALPAHAQAETYPNKPIRIVVGYSPAGAADFVARIVGDAMAKELSGCSARPACRRRCRTGSSRPPPRSWPTHRSRPSCPAQAEAAPSKSQAESRTWAAENTRVILERLNQAGVKPE